MLRKSLLRILALLILVVLVFAGTKLLVRSLPGDPVETLIAETGTNVPIETLRRELRLDEPYLPALRHQIRDAFRGDFGKSIIQKRPIGPLLADRMLHTLQLAGLALVLGLSAAFVLALGASLPHRGQAAFERIVRMHGALSAALPTPWIGPLLAYGLAVRLTLFPLGGHVLLPALTLAFGMSGFWARMIRESLRAEARKPSVQSARARGVDEFRLLWKYALFPVSSSLLAYLGTQAGSLLAGAFITETIFDWPGMGSLLIEGIFRRDYPVVEAAIFVSASTILLGNFLGDLAQRLAHPRLRQAESEATP